MAVYVQNRSPHRILEKNTHEEAFIGVRKYIGDLRIFCCPIYIHAHNEKRKNLEPFGRRSTFVRYKETLKAYQVYTPGQRYVEISWDVKFEEDLDLRRSQEILAGGEEQEAPKVEESIVPFSTGVRPSYHKDDSEEKDLADPPSSQDTRPKWI